MPKPNPKTARPAGVRTTVRRTRSVSHTIPAAPPRPRAVAAPASRPQPNGNVVAAWVLGIALVIGGGAIGYGLMNQPKPTTDKQEVVNRDRVPPPATSARTDLAAIRAEQQRLCDEQAAGRRTSGG